MPFRVLACTARESAAKAARQDTTNSVNSDAELCARLHQLLQHLPGAVTAGSGSSNIDLYRLEALQPSLGLERSSVWVAGDAGIGHADDGVQPYGDVLWSKITFKADCELGIRGRMHGRTHRKGGRPVGLSNSCPAEQSVQEEAVLVVRENKNTCDGRESSADLSLSHQIASDESKVPRAGILVWIKPFFYISRLGVAKNGENLFSYTSPDLSLSYIPLIES